ncbi:MAG TPA: VPDSG-CTERM sorting domain-containing protein [Chthoniobacterales bacterium]|nr:VPDSG-CTERM sorting domain-containing protein [Chthoniobacterales bacterium]
MRKLPVLFAQICLFAAAGGIYADTIWDNGAPSTTAGAVKSDIGQPGFGASQVGDDFTLTGSATLTQVQWWGLYSEDLPAADNFTIQFFTISSGVPASTPLLSYNVGNIGRTDSGLNASSGEDIYQFTAAIPNTVLGSGQYLVSVFNNQPQIDNTWYWVMTDPTFSSQSWNRFGPGNPPWNPPGSADFAFNISGFSNSASVPDTSATALLLGLSFAGLVQLRRLIA